MTKRLLLFFAVEAMLLAVALLADRWHKDTQRPEHFALTISAYLDRQEAEALAWANAQRPLLEKMQAAGQDLASGELEPALAEQAQKDYTVLLLRGDSLIFWSNNAALPTRPELARLMRIESDHSLVQLPLGYYSARSDAFGANKLLILTPIRFTLDDQDPTRQKLFPADPAIPPQVRVRATPTDYPVRAGGRELCWLEAGQSATAEAGGWLVWLKFGAYLLFFVFLAVFVQRSASALTDRYGPAAGAGWMAAIVGSLFWLNVQFNFTGSQFGTLPLFAQHFSEGSRIGASLGDWLIYIALLLWLMFFFHRNFRVRRLGAAPQTLRLALAGLYYFAVLCSVPVAAAVFRQLIFQSDIHFDFDNLLNIDAPSLLALTGLSLMLTGLFLFGHRMVLTAHRLELPPRLRRIAAGGAALLLAVLCFGMSELQVNPLVLAGFAVLYVATLDFFIDSEQPGFGWIVVWLVVFALFASQMLYHYNALKDRELRQTYAAALATDRDTALAEPLLIRLHEQLAADAQLPFLLKPWPFKPDADSLRNYLNTRVFAENYLFQHYRLRVFAFDRDHQPLLIGQNQDWAYVDGQNWQNSQALPGHDEVRYRADIDGSFRYLFRLRYNRMNDPGHPAELYCFFDREYPKATRVYAELFFNQPLKNLDRLDNYDYSIWENDRLVVEKGPRNPMLNTLRLDPGQSAEITSLSPERVDAVQRSADGSTVATVGRATGGWLKPVYLFSILFAFASLFLFSLALANSWLRFLPDNYQFFLSMRGSLAKRIHYSNVALIVVGFLVIGWLSYRQFDRSSRQTDQTGLDYRSTTMLNHLRAELGSLTGGSDTARRALPPTLAPFANSLSIDANLFAPDGSLIFTTRDDLRQLGILPGKMSSQALFALGNSPQSEILVSEKTAGFDYFTQYMSIRNNQNQLLGYLGVPYNFAERRVGPEVSDFVGMLASLYVFLLLIAAAVTFFLANTIIRPVKMIGDQLNQLRLEDKNEPLQYTGDSQDELSELIREYNRMVDTLEDSKIQLIRLEREGAWREMARQVAHDIKNPLTTMKLSMQQLERVSSDPAQAAAYLKKAITRLIEQIDSLAQIASEFSMFANLDVREKHDMVLNDVVESVYDLFSEQKDLTHELDLPTERIHILGDKNYLLRVFNNLVINAMQAIPSDRRGHISVSLHREGDRAIARISDNGGGIPPEIRGRVFEPNFTTKTSGSGLGLAICRKIIEALDGTIRFETRENEGTDFFVELPVVSVESTPLSRNAVSGASS